MDLPVHGGEPVGMQEAGMGITLCSVSGHIKSTSGCRVGTALTGGFIPCRFHFTLELFLTGEKVQQLGADSADTLQAWASAIGKVSWALSMLLSPSLCRLSPAFTISPLASSHSGSLL